MEKEFAFINLFRAIAAFWVLCAHCLIWGGWYGVPLPSAKIAVDLFMVISGYLMAANASSRLDVEPISVPQNWARFWARRYFRLAPAYYFELGLAVIFAAPYLDGYLQLQRLNPGLWVDGGIYDPRTINYSLTNLMLHLSFLFGLHPRYSFSTFLPDWSLSLEMQFYLIFPFLFNFSRRFGTVFVSFGIGILAYALGREISHHIVWFEPSLLVFKLNYFIAGMVLYAAISLPPNQLRQRRTAAGCALLLTAVDMRYGLQVFVLPLLMGSMLYIGWLENTQRTPNWLTRLLKSRLVHFASDTSYGVYLFHGFFISASGLIICNSPPLLALPPHLRVLGMFFFVSLGAYASAYLAHRCIELPGIKWGRVIINRCLPNHA